MDLFTIQAVDHPHQTPAVPPALLSMLAPQGPWNPVPPAPASASVASGYASPEYVQLHLVFDAERGTFASGDDGELRFASNDSRQEEAPPTPPPAGTAPRRRTLATPFADLNPSQVRAVAADAADIVMHVDTLERSDADVESLLEAAQALAPRAAHHCWRSAARRRRRPRRTCRARRRRPGAAARTPARRRPRRPLPARAAPGSTALAVPASAASPCQR